jgi:flagellar hook protein FlgE
MVIIVYLFLLFAYFADIIKYTQQAKETTMNISSAASVSGMQAAIIRQSVSAHDIANINTEGFGQYTAHQTDIKPSGTRVSNISREPNSPGNPSNTELTTEAVEQKESLNNLKANSAVIKVQDKMMGALLDIFA